MTCLESQSIADIDVPILELINLDLNTRSQESMGKERAIPAGAS